MIQLMVRYSVSPRVLYCYVECGYETSDMPRKFAKPDGRCIAAKEIVDGRPGPWVRPVSAREAGELSAGERRYPGHKEPEVGDVFTAVLLGPREHAYQKENFLIDGRQKWKFEKSVTFEQLVTCIDACPGDIWRYGISSSNGRNDQISLASASALEGSLKLLRVQTLVVRVKRQDQDGRKVRKYRGAFSLNGSDYILSITDPKIRIQYELCAEGDYELSDVLICVSLGEPWHGYTYKLIAAVITKGI